MLEKLLPAEELWRPRHPSGCAAEITGKICILPEPMPPWAEWEAPEGCPDLSIVLRGRERGASWVATITPAAASMLRAAAETEADRAYLVRAGGMLGIAAVEACTGRRTVKGAFLHQPESGDGEALVPIDQLAKLVPKAGARIEAYPHMLVVHLGDTCAYVATCPAGDLPRGELSPARKARAPNRGGSPRAAVRLPADAWPKGPGDVDLRSKT